MPTKVEEYNAQMDRTTQFAYAKKMCEAYPTILSFLGYPNPLFEGREEEVMAVKESLLKRRMKNCVLIGSPGVGKTEIMKRALSEVSADMAFLNMDLASMLSGCTLVGMFEERFTKIVDAIAKNNRRSKTKIAFFIDEIHNLFRVGKSDQYGTMSGGEILKPYLAEGSIIVMGATTMEEYEKYIKADKALLRRLPPIFVNGMDDAQTARIVKSFGKSKMTKGLADYVVSKSHSVNYLNNPDCSLEIADRAMARALARGKELDKTDVDIVVSMMVGEPEN